MSPRVWEGLRGRGSTPGPGKMRAEGPLFEVHDISVLVETYKTEALTRNIVVLLSSTSNAKYNFQIRIDNNNHPVEEKPNKKHNP